MRNFLYLISVLNIVSCNQGRQSGFTVNGQIDGGYKGYIYLKYGKSLDSTLVENGSFRFDGTVSHPVKSILFPGSPGSDEQMYIGVFMLENSEISVLTRYHERNVDGSPEKILDIDSVLGSKSQRLREKFELKMASSVHSEENDSLQGALLYKNLHGFLRANPKSEMSGEYLAGLGGYYNSLNGKQMEALLGLIDTSYQTKNDLNKIQGIIEQKKVFEIGNAPPGILLPDPQGRMTDRSKFKGKIVLLEFWASWCAPCRQTNPELLKTYDAFKNEGFDILGISIDRDTEEWRSAIKEDKLSWTQVIDTLRITAETFNLTSIPFNLLLDRDGKIIAKNIKPIELREILEQL